MLSRISTTSFSFVLRSAPCQRSTLLLLLLQLQRPVFSSLALCHWGRTRTWVLQLGGHGLKVVRRHGEGVRSARLLVPLYRAPQLDSSACALPAVSSQENRYKQCIGRAASVGMQRNAMRLAGCT